MLVTVASLIYPKNLRPETHDDRLGAHPDSAREPSVSLNACTATYLDLASAARTRSGVNGTSRRRTPVAS